eukprot:8352898-Pyramimonas_sp.AAC.1
MLVRVWASAPRHASLGVGVRARVCWFGCGRLLPGMLVRVWVSEPGYVGLGVGVCSQACEFGCG